MPARLSCRPADGLRGSASPEPAGPGGGSLAEVTWATGEVIVRREIWRGRPWFANVVVVVEDTADLLATFLPEGSPFAFPPSADGRPHPWTGRRAWQGHGVLMLQRPGEAYAVRHFWEGPERRFHGWYLNVQEPFRRTSVGLDTQDLELDVWLPAEGGWRFKDAELLDERVRDGRFTPSQVAAVRALGETLGSHLEEGGRWWSDRWTSFVPDPSWSRPAFPPGWEDAAIPPAPPPDELLVRPLS